MDKTANDVTADQAELRTLLEQQSLVPLWEVYDKVVTREPSNEVPSHIWKWADYSRPLKLTTRTVKGNDADHRVLVLKNPNFGGRFASTNTIVGAVQCVLPGEKTRPHRHTPSAVRIVLESRGAATFVDGQRCEMHDGDFVITPNWTWHGHENKTDAPAIWVDLLDVPLNKALNNVFGQMDPPNDYPETVGTLPDVLFESGGLMPATARTAGAYSPRFRYAAADVAKVLAAMPPEADGSRRVRYTNPLDGGPVVATIDAAMLQIAGGKPTQRRRISATGLCVVLEGSGESRIGGVTHKWNARDIFTLPEWAWVEHIAATPTARMLVATDRQVRERLGLWREEIAA